MELKIPSSIFGPSLSSATLVSSMKAQPNLKHRTVTFQSPIFNFPHRTPRHPTSTSTTQRTNPKTNCSPPRRPRSTSFNINQSETHATTTPTCTLFETIIATPTFTRFTQAALCNLPFYLSLRYKLLPQPFLTSSGLTHACFLGMLLWTTNGLAAYTLVFSFLVIGSLATKVGKKRKQSLGIAEKRDGKRGPENLWGAAGVAALCSILSRLFELNSLPAYSLYMMVSFCAAVAAKCADTVSSEIGKAYGTTTYLSTTLQTVPRGTEGAISLEGTVAGMIAALFTSLFAEGLGLVSGAPFIFIIIVSAVVANFSESIIGATIQNQSNLTNEQVNFINTLISAFIAFLICLLIYH